MDSAIKALNAELTGPAPEGLEPLGADGIATLATMVGKAKRSQAEALDSSIQKGLDAVPMLLRRPVKKILFG